MADALTTQAQSLFSENVNFSSQSNAQMSLKSTESNMGFFAKLKQISNQSALAGYEKTPLFKYQYKRSPSSMISTSSSRHSNPMPPGTSTLFSSISDDNGIIQKRSSKLD